MTPPATLAAPLREMRDCPFRDGDAADRYNAAESALVAHVEEREQRIAALEGALTRIEAKGFEWATDAIVQGDVSGKFAALATWAVDALHPDTGEESDCRSIPR